MLAIFLILVGAMTLEYLFPGSIEQLGKQTLMLALKLAGLAK